MSSIQEQLKAKHQPLDQHQGAIGAARYCVGCKTSGGLLNTPWPCDVVRLLEELVPTDAIFATEETE